MTAGIISDSTISNKPYTFSADHRANLSKAHMGKSLSTEHKENIRKSLLGHTRLLGYKHTTKARLNMGKSKLGNKYNLGNKASEETKLKMSKAHLGKKLTNKHKEKLRTSKLGKNNPRYGIKHSEETKLKMSKSRIGKKHSEETLKKISGKNSPQWLGGKSFEPYTPNFNKTLKKKIRLRDKYECQICFKHQNKLNRALNIHHIDYNKKNNKTTNLVSLCTSCHIHTNINRERWEKYFKTKSDSYEC